jgi:nucleoside phosphorylase/tetratricopeptide (TPR) repeat protein
VTGGQQPSSVAVVLTAHGEEYQALRDRLKDVEPLLHPSGTRAECGRLPGTGWHVVLAEIGEGSLTAAVLTERFTTWLSPEAVYFVGVAGGLKDEAGIGDVVVATKIYAVQGGKQTPEGFLVRPDAWHPSHRLEQAARYALRGKAHLKPIAVADIVLADSDSAIAEHLHRHYNDAFALEMESAGVLQAAHLAGQDALIIRGIGNKADRHKDRQEAEGGRLLAARNSAAAVCAVLTACSPLDAAAADQAAGEGELIASLPPEYGIELEIHPAIAGPTGRILPTLTQYVERDHDMRLRAVVDRAAAGSSGIAVLVGSSSAGKTRACWEAIRRLPSGWRMWHPIAPSRAEALSDGLDNVRPRTVIWLNEAQHYLNTTGSEVGSALAARLRALLRDEGRGPVLVLGTLWPEYYADLTDSDTSARDLLKDHAIEVPDAFHGAALSALRAAAARDERLQEAVSRAEDGQITQYLAGVPAVLDRYRTAPSSVRAVLEAAMDLRRLQCGPVLQPDVLREAAAGYMPSRQWDALSDDWFTRALDHVTQSEPCRGARSPLYRSRPRVGSRAVVRGGWLLSDALEQLGHGTRAGLPVPETVWAAGLEYGDEELRMQLAAAAEQRGLKRTAIELLASPARGGSGQAWTSAGRVLENTGQTGLALACFAKAVEAGDGHAWWDGATALNQAAAPLDEAVSWYLAAVRHDGVSALLMTLHQLLKAGRDGEAADLVREHGYVHGSVLTDHYKSIDRADDAAAFLREAAKAGSAEAMAELAEYEERCGRRDEAESWMRAAAAADGDEFEPALAELLRQHGALAEAIDRYKALTMHWRHSDEAIGAVPRLLAEADRSAEIEPWLRELAQARRGHTEVDAYLQFLESAGKGVDAYDWIGAQEGLEFETGMWAAVQLLEEQGHLEDAVELLRRAAEAGNPDAVFPARPLMAVGRVDEAIAWMRAWSETGAPHAHGPGLWLLDEAGHREEVIAHLRHEALEGDPGEVWHAHALLEQAGMLDSALGWLKQRPDQDREVVSATAHLLRVSGTDPAQLIGWFQKAAELGDDSSWGWVKQLAVDSGLFVPVLKWAEPLARAGDPHASKLTADLSLEYGAGEEALRWYLRNWEAGLGIWPNLRYLMERVGRADLFPQLITYGIEPGGRIAASWDAGALLGVTPYRYKPRRGISLRKP